MAKAPTDSGAIEQPGGKVGGSSRAATVAGVGLIVLLFAVSVGLVMQGGAYAPSTWLPLMAAVAALALVVAIAGPAVFSGRFQKVLLLVFFLQAAWTAASLFWAGSRANAWEETNRTVLYLLTLVLVFVAVRWAGGAALKVLAVSVAVLAGGVAVWVLVDLLISGSPLTMFLDGRLDYPVTYFNGLAALLMVGFWLSLGMANGARRPRRSDPDYLSSGEGALSAQVPQSRVAWRRSQAQGQRGDQFPRWTQPLLLILAVVLLEVALLPQSRGALWTFFLVIPFFVILSPNRFRALINLLIVAAPVVVLWHRLNSPYLAITGNTPLDAAIHNFLFAVAYSAGAVLVAWAITWLIERWIGPLRRRVALWIGVVVAAVAILGAAGGIVYSDIRTGGLDTYLTDHWHQFTGDAVGNTQGTTRFTGVGLNGRLKQWKVALKAFEENPLLGLGAQNFEAYWYQHRTVAFAVRQPHSQPLQLLAELGLPGALLWIIFTLATLIRAATVRFRAPDWGKRVMLASIMTAAISWFIHSSADWLWQLAGVSLPAIMLLGGLLGADKNAVTPEGVKLPFAADTPPPPDVLEGTEVSGAGEAGEAAATGELPAVELPLAVEIPAPAGRRRARTDKGPRRSVVARGIAVVIAVVALASAALPYLSQHYSAQVAASTDLNQAADRANLASELDPTSTEPYTALAAVHQAAAAKASSPAERVQQLRLAAASWEDAVKLEPDSWVCQFGAAQALVAASNAALAVDRNQAQELEQEARMHLDEAHRLNPLSTEIQDLQESLGSLSGTGSDSLSTTGSY